MNIFRVAVAAELALVSIQSLHQSWLLPWAGSHLSNPGLFPLGGSDLAQVGVLLGAAYIIDEIKRLAFTEHFELASSSSTKPDNPTANSSGSNRPNVPFASPAGAARRDDTTTARHAIEADNSELRDKFVLLTKALTRAQLLERLGHYVDNPGTIVAQWEDTGAIFSVKHLGIEVFPAFQFQDNRPHPTIGKALAALPAGLSPWQRAFWFVSTNGWLDDKAPADCLDDLDAVLAAAAHEALEVVG